jgi:hypothetical protein
MGATFPNLVSVSEMPAFASGDSFATCIAIIATMRLAKS